MGKYYAVANGRSKGVYSNWNDCREQVNGYSNAQFKSFSTPEAAQEYVSKGATSHPSGSNYWYKYGSSLGRSGNGSSRSSSLRSSARSPYSSRSKSHAVPSSDSFGGLGSSTHESADKPVTVYTDGSSLGNGRNGATAGYGVFWGHGDSRNASGKVTVGEQSNNRGELMGIGSAVRTIATERGSRRYEICSDSQYSRDALGKWGDKWETNGWKTSSGEPVKNRDLIESTRAELRRVRASGVQVDIKYVPAHSGVEGNEQADMLAKRAASS